MQSELPRAPHPPAAALTGAGWLCPHSSAGCWGGSRCQLGSAGLAWAPGRQWGGRTALQDSRGTPIAPQPSQRHPGPFSSHRARAGRGPGFPRLTTFASWSWCWHQVLLLRPHEASPEIRWQREEPSHHLGREGWSMGMLAALRVHPTPQGHPHLGLPRRVLHDGERRGVGRAVSHQRRTKHTGQVEHVHLAVRAARHPARRDRQREHTAA